SGIPLGLREDALRAESELLGFDYCQDRAVHVQGIVGWATCGIKLRDGAVPVGVERHPWREWKDITASRLELGVNKALPGEPLGIVFCCRHQRSKGKQDRLYPGGLQMGTTKS